MRKQAAVLVLVFFAFATIAEAAMPNPFRGRNAAKDPMFPEAGDIQGLERISKILSYKNEKFSEFYGKAGNRYVQYGMISLMSAEYIYGGKDRRVTIEIATMEKPTAAAGLFHYHRGSLVGGKSESVEVGAEGLLDRSRKGRNLYFYRSNLFVKILYGGKDPVPDLLPIARFLDGKIPSGRDAKPDGFAYIDVEGINRDTIALTPGFTFNISFMPPSVWASAPGGGSVASDLFIITKLTDKEATELYNDYSAYLKLHAEYHEEYKRGSKQRFFKAVDPNQGRVVFTHYRNALIIAARPDGYEKGEVLPDAVMSKIDSENPSKKKKKNK